MSPGMKRGRHRKKYRPSFGTFCPKGAFNSHPAIPIAFQVSLERYLKSIAKTAIIKNSKNFYRWYYAFKPYLQNICAEYGLDLENVVYALDDGWYKEHSGQILLIRLGVTAGIIVAVAVLWAFGDELLKRKGIDNRCYIREMPKWMTSGMKLKTSY